ncbi:MAG: hypothetical protein JW993_05615 [Sedimentisphaerales bacterium]|nr:hypothetical protein [Sedimentisphaerales bacterium]
MKCPACGAENADGTSRCISCEATLDETPTVTVRISRLALASAALALVTLLGAIPVVMAVRDQWFRHEHTALILVSGSLSIIGGGAGLLLGLIAWGLIGSSGGRVTGRGFAVIGVLIPVGAMLAALTPALMRGPSLSLRLRCGTNLSGIGKAMLIYANDYDDKLPIAGGQGTIWGLGPKDWAAGSRLDAFGLDPNGAGGEASICSSLYLLIRHAEMTPKSFVCPEERKVTEFDPVKYKIGGKKLTDVWDFGPDPATHCSYAYHAPYSRYPLNTANHPGLAVAADRNPWIRSPSGKAGDITKFKPDVAPFDGRAEEARKGNSLAHWGGGQNVLYLDTHVEWVKQPYVSYEDDNIYTLWDGDDRLRGIPPQPYDAQPADRRDALLLNDPLRR